MAGTASYIPAPRSIIAMVAHPAYVLAPTLLFTRSTNPINRPLYGFYVQPLQTVNQTIPVRLE
jgi:hypothetical protein